MKKYSVEKTMFYNAKPEIFKKAENLRFNTTEAEKLLWEKLRKKQLGVRFKAQHPIDKFIADFYCHKVKLVIELDGEIYNNQKEYDLGRETEIEKFGIKVIRFANKEEINNIDDVIDKIKEYLVITTPTRWKKKDN